MLKHFQRAYRVHPPFCNQSPTYGRLPYLVNGESPYVYRVEREPVVRNLPGARSSCRYYLVCPQMGRRATVRYRCSGAGIFAHREAFASQQRL